MDNVGKDGESCKPKARRHRESDGPWAILRRTKRGIRRYIARGFVSKDAADAALVDLLRFFAKEDPWRSILFVGLWEPTAQKEKE